MESSAGKGSSAGGGAQNSKKTKCLDLQSIYRTEALKESSNKEGNFSEHNEGRVGNTKKKRKKGKSAKEAALDGFMPIGKKKRKVLDEGSRMGPGPVLTESDKSLPKSCQKAGLNGISLNLAENGNVIHIPKRPRGFVGRKKSGSVGPAKTGGSSSSARRVGRLSGEPIKGEPSGSSIAKVVSSDKKNTLVNSSAGNASDSDAVASYRDQKLKLVTSSAGDAGDSITVAGRGDKKVKSVTSSAGRAAEVASGDKNANLRTSAAGNSRDTNAMVGSCDKKIKLGTSSASNAHDSIAVTGSRDKKVKLAASSAGNAGDSKVKRKRAADETKEMISGGGDSAQQVKEEDGDAIVSASRRPRNNLRKRQNFPSGSRTAMEKVGKPSMGNGAFDELQDDEDDEENLERNAARMLSSRFDPRCTGFSSKSRTSRMPSESGLSIPVSSDRDCRDDPSAGNADSRVLRPRNQLKKKGVSRKRRHFYEVLASNFDARWFLNQRIKVFWPLDESWYYGLVKDYDPESKLHHVKYDDRDEEWINLHDEKFKILLLPSELCGKMDCRRSSMASQSVDREKKDVSEDDDGYSGNYLDSEPIISWLARPSRRIKSSPSAVKKQKTLQLSPAVKTDDRNGNEVPLTEDANRYGYGFSSRFNDIERVENSLLGTPSSSKGGTFIVYFRRRFRKKGKGIFPAIFESDESSRQLRTFSLSASVGADSPLNKKEGNGSFRCLDADMLCWSFDDHGLLRLRMPLLESVRFKFDLSLPVFPFLDYAFKMEQLWLSGILLLPHYGTITITWPEVVLEMLFVDNTVGLRLLLFEVSLRQAVALFAIIMSVFNQPSGERKVFDVQLPITSIHFRLSNVLDFRMQWEFTFYSFSKLRHSKRLYLDSQLQQHCLLTKQLPLSDCTYDNLKSLEGGSNGLFTCSGASAPSHLKKRSMRGILPLGVSREYAKTRMNYSPCSSVQLRKTPAFAISFTSAPTFFLRLHLQLLMEHNFASISLQGSDSLASSEDSEVASMLNAVEFPEVDSCLEKVPDSCMDASVTVVDDGKQRNQDLEKGKLTVILKSHSKHVEKNQVDASVQIPRCKLDDRESEQAVASAAPSVSTTITSPGMSHFQSYSSKGSLRVQLPYFEQNDKPFDGRANISSQASDLAGSVNNGVVQSPYSTGLRSSWDRDRNGSNSSPLGDFSPLWSDGKANFMHNGFGNGPKKPRTQVRYSLPQGGHDFSLKHKGLNQRSLPHKRIRRSNEKRISDGLKVSEKNIEMLSCDANVLVTLRDKGWRESGACVVLELTDHNEWKLAVKVSGVTKYSHKVNHILQPGSTNRYTHSMMWKGGKDWVLEFPDRSQWILFKEMYEECYNRNIRAASVKNIPIPGVRLVEDNDDYATDMPFIRNSLKYLRQVENDVEMALNPSHILYDMDSDDEQWRKSSRGDDSKFEEVSDELFEKTMDTLEKLAYSQQQDKFTDDELQGLMVGIDSIESVKAIYEYWKQKRQRKGMPLIRHFQPPLWEIYQQQVKEWEEAIARTNSGFASGCKDKAESMEKPPMFAFCLKPRGLELPNKGSKQRSQKRFSVSGHHQAISGDHDRLHNFGKSHEFWDTSPSLHQSTRLFSPRDSGGINNFSTNSDVSDWNRYPKFQRNKLKKNGALPYPNNSHLLVSHSPRTTGMRNGVHKWNMELSDWPSQKYHHYEGPQRHGIQTLDGSDFHEFRLRDASTAAKHAHNVAKLKREKAQRLLYRADLAIHKAVAAIMTAEAIKASAESSNGDS